MKDEKMALIDVDSRGRTSLGRLGVAEGRYLGEVEEDGTLVLHPAVVMSKAQAALLASPEVMKAIDEFAADPSSGTRRSRPRRRPAL